MAKKKVLKKNKPTKLKNKSKRSIKTDFEKLLESLGVFASEQEPNSKSLDDDSSGLNHPNSPPWIHFT